MCLMTWSRALKEKTAEASLQRTDAASLTERLDRLPLVPFHFLLFTLMFIGLAFDHMDQVVISFALPYYREEWGLSATVASINPTTALAGTFVGALVWGIVADRIGRKRVLIIGILMFSLGTLYKGLALDFVSMSIVCAIGAVGVGGAIPMTFTLLAEYTPAKYRGATMVTMGILAIVVGYLIASASALVLLETFGWRSLFLVGFSSILLVPLIAKFVPESPRFLVSKGRAGEARRIVERLEASKWRRASAFAHEMEESRMAGVAGTETVGAYQSGEGSVTLNNVGQLWKPEYRRRTLMLWTYAFAFGFFTFGFLSWLPSVLKAAGLTNDQVHLYTTLMDLTAFPAAVLTAFLYLRWSTKRVLTLYPFIAGVAMLVLAFLVMSQQLTPALVISVGAVIFFFGTILLGAFGPYSVEVYPTEIRGTGSGWATGFSRFGAFLAIPLGGLFLGSALPLFVHQLIFGIPLFVSTLVMLAWGVETRGRRLESIGAG